MLEDDFPEGLTKEEANGLSYPNEPEYDVKVEKIKVFANNEDLTKKRIVNGKEIPSVIESAKILKEVEHKIGKKSSPELPNGKEDYEKCKDVLIKSQHNTYEDPDNHYCEIDIPSSVKFGEDLVIKLSKKPENIHYVLGDGYEWKKKVKFDPLNTEWEIQLRPTVSKEQKKYNSKEIRIPIGKIQNINKIDHQMWLEGYYYVVVRAYANEWHEDTVVKRMVKVTK